MKKILLATTAVVAMSTVSAEAFAADKIKLELGGFMRQYVGLANNDEVAATANTTAAVRSTDLQQWANSEVYFRGSTTTDNGLKVSADIQMETSNRTSGTRNYDISSLEISSDAIGAVTIGSTSHGADDFAVRVPQASGLDWGDMGNNFGSYADTATATTVAAGYSVGFDMAELGAKGLKLKYVSPNFSGVNAFVSYSATEAGGQLNQTNNGTDAYTYGVAFGGEVSGASVSADLAHTSNAVATGVDSNRFGLNVGMGGFTVGGGYSNFNDGASLSNSAATVSNNDGTGYEFGAAYATGPYTVSAGYTAVKSKGTTTTVGDNKDTTWALAGAYDLGAGVALTGTYYSSKFDAEGTGTTVALGKSYTVKGFIAGVEVGF